MGRNTRYEQQRSDDKQWRLPFPDGPRAGRQNYSENVAGLQEVIRTTYGIIRAHSNRGQRVHAVIRRYLTE